MTGKTSLATLVSRSLVERHREEKKKMAVINFSALAIPDDSTFEEVFKTRCEIGWSEATLHLPKAGYKVYLVLDETQVLFKNGNSSPKCKSSGFWELVKYFLSDAHHNVRVLMFAAYGSRVERSSLATPIHFEKQIVLGSDKLNFSHAEVVEYVTKWFKGVDGLSSPEMEAFCANVEELTGGHVGLCTTVIHALNEVYASRGKSVIDLPSPAEWIRMLQSGSLYRTNDNALFEAMTSTRAVEVLKDLKSDELDRLERIAYGADPHCDAVFVEQCLRTGILVETERQLVFSSPVMWRLFVRMRVGQTVRALHVPKTLPEMIA
ncbi:hypothetical protein F442_22702 [Phytophthora nicotianae P10297]|uniref:Uncharacterized protein n=4 Tax=Phytophthora nicotianae TaxID=4792 RepID=W2Y043_PHYNI|nr:hypothetical protein F442_22702 [Phytophthora nicotianae P10297]